MAWTTDPPTEIGYYWFYGEIHAGSMGQHYRKGINEFQLKLVEVVQLGGRTLVGVTEGQMVHLRPFTEKLEGYYGKFCPAILPEPPPLDPFVP